MKKNKIAEIFICINIVGLLFAFANGDVQSSADSNLKSLEDYEYFEDFIGHREKLQDDYSAYDYTNFGYPTNTDYQNGQYQMSEGSNYNQPSSYQTMAALLQMMNQANTNSLLDATALCESRGGACATTSMCFYGEPKYRCNMTAVCCMTKYGEQLIERSLELQASIVQTLLSAVNQLAPGNQYNAKRGDISQNVKMQKRAMFDSRANKRPQDSVPENFNSIKNAPNIDTLQHPVDYADDFSIDYPVFYGRERQIAEDYLNSKEKRRFNVVENSIMQQHRIYDKFVANDNKRSSSKRQPVGIDTDKTGIIKTDDALIQFGSDGSNGVQKNSNSHMFDNFNKVYDEHDTVGSDQNSEILRN